MANQSEAIHSCLSNSWQGRRPLPIICSHKELHPQLSPVKVISGG
nr:MAG TPA: hypothetical protein [Caudoviricetes sp.]